MDGSVNTSETLCYGLRPGVSFFREKGGVGLILSFPLKVIRLAGHWGGVLELLSQSETVSQERILKEVEGDNPDRVELFLNDLVRKGFLFVKGIGGLTEHPRLSVVVPVRNRPDDIEACLESLLKLEYAGDRLEIIVVDDASTDDTRSRISRFPVRLVSMEERQGASSCRNLGAQRAAGDIVAFLDSDCTVEPGWLRELLPAFKDRHVAGVGGWVDSYYKEKTLDRYEKVKSSLFMGVWPKTSSKENRFFYVPSCNLLVRKEAFTRVGGFNEALSVGEDVDLCWRLQNKGYRMEYRPLGRVFHKHRNSLKAFCLRRFDYGTSEPLLQRLHGDREKHMLFPLGAAVFWALVFLCLLVQTPFPLALAGGGLILEVLSRHARVRRHGIPIKRFTVLFAVMRSYAAFSYHLCAFISRYYLLLSFVLLPWIPVLSAIPWGMHAVVWLVEYFNKRPSLHPLAFLWYFTLEQLSYQSGVWWACLKTFNFNPVNPRLATAVR